MDPLNPVNTMDVTSEGQRICVITSSFSLGNQQVNQASRRNAQGVSSASQVVSIGGHNRDTSPVARGSTNVSGSSRIMGHQL